MSRHTLMVASLALLALPLLAAGPASAANPGPAAPVPPGIRLWTSHGDTYHRGEAVRIYFRTERDAYVTIFRVDTDGRLRILFPRDPGDPNLAHGGQTYDVEGVNDRDAFYVDDYPGVGYVFGVASQDPFDYDALAGNDHWDFEAAQNLTDGRLHGDPYATLQQLVQQIEPEGYADYDTHLLPYYVEQHYDYPRFLCYDCHTYLPYAAWNPYTHFCTQYSLFVYYDPFYFYPSYWYPTRYYGGTAVVYVRPRFAGSQYVFKSPGDRAAPSVVFRDRRNTGMPSGPADRGVRGVDLGGVGSVPSPVGGGRRMPGAGPLQSPGGTPIVQHPGAEGAVQAPGRRYAPVTDLGVIGPSAPAGGTGRPAPASGADGRRYIGAPAQAAAGGAQAGTDAPRARGVYIEPGNRSAPQPGQQAPPPAAAAGRYAQPGGGAAQRGQAQAPPRDERRSAPPAAAAPPTRSEPRAQPQSRPAGRSGGTPTLIRRRP